MKYVISEEELKDVYSFGWIDGMLNKDHHFKKEVEDFLKSKSPVEEIKIHGIQGNSGTGDGMLYVSKSDLMKNLVFDKIYVVVR